MGIFEDRDKMEKVCGVETRVFKLDLCKKRNSKKSRYFFEADMNKCPSKKEEKKLNKLIDNVLKSATELHNYICDLNHKHKKQVIRKNIKREVASAAFRLFFRVKNTPYSERKEIQ